MNTRSIQSCRFGGRHTASAAMVMTLLGILPVGTIADQPPATKPIRVAEVSLSDLNISTPEGMRLTRERLHAMAERVCAGGDGRGPSSQPAIGACVDGTVANALRHIDALRQEHLKVLNTVTLGAGVSFADLDLSTLEGADIARQRLDSMAHRLCGELARRRDLVYPQSYAACVHETLARALAQTDALAAAGSARTAQRSRP